MRFRAVPDIGQRRLDHVSRIQQEVISRHKGQGLECFSLLD
jgi:hypothetical protein